MPASITEKNDDNCIRFALNGEIVELRDVSPALTLLRYLRETRGLTGTKEGCAAGDCGACTVVVARLAQAHTSQSGSQPEYHAINACLAPLATLHGKLVLTVDALAGPGGALHPVQQAMVDCHASQCGFCTPGFVMSLYARSLMRATPTDHASIADDLAGNLCRCTGYRPIVEAAERACATAAPDWDSARRRGDRDLLRKIAPDQRATIAQGDTTAFIPTTLDDACDLASEHPTATIISGATDTGLWITKQNRAFKTVIYTSAISDRRFTGIEATPSCIYFGAGATHSQGMNGSRGDLHALWQRFAGLQVRNVGTIGGNIANASPIGDLAPAFLALGATLHLRHGKTARTLPLDAFFLSYGKTALKAGELLIGIEVPAAAVSTLSIHKVSKRFDDDISAVCGAFSIDVEAGMIANARIAFGGMAAITKRATAVETALIGKPWTRDTIDAALPAFAHDFQPLTDMRASRAYRLDVARNLLVRTFIERTTENTQTRLFGASKARTG